MIYLFIRIYRMISLWFLMIERLNLNVVKFLFLLFGCFYFRQYFNTYFSNSKFSWYWKVFWISLYLCIYCYDITLRSLYVTKVKINAQDFDRFPRKTIWNLFNFMNSQMYDVSNVRRNLYIKFTKTRINQIKPKAHYFLIFCRMSFLFDCIIQKM